MTTKTSQISDNILGFLGFISRWVAQRQQRSADEKAKREQLEHENAERAQTEKLLFLKLLQTMCKVCEELKPIPWITHYNGWLQGNAVRALTEEHDPIKPLYEICLQDPKSNRSINLYNLEVYQLTPKFEQIYSVSYRFVSDKNLPYLRAVFDLTAHSDISSPERAQILEELKNIEIKKSQYWNDYPEAGAIEYLEGLLSQNQSK